MLYQISICMLLGYVLGSINPSYILGRMKGFDVRKDGSGNAGASNAFLLIGKSAFFIVAAFDIAKAAISWKLAAALFPKLKIAGVLGGVSCTLGHMFPAVLHFKGGKGFACLGGMILAYEPRSFLFFLAVAILIGVLTNYIFIVTGSISLLFPAFYGLTSHNTAGTLLLFLLAIPILWRHRENYLRMRAGKEARLSAVFNKQKEMERLGISKEAAAKQGSDSAR